MKMYLKLSTILLLAFTIFSCTKDTQVNEDSVSSNFSKSVEEDSEISAHAFIENLYNENPTLLESLELVDEYDNSFFLSKFEISGISDSELFATIDTESNSIKLFIEINWSEGYASMTDVYWNQTETFVIDENSEIIQGVDLMAAAQQGSTNSQTTASKFRNRGFGWTCGPVVDLPGGSFRTCCHRLFWRTTKPCDQYGSDKLPGRNPRIVSL